MTDIRYNNGKIYTIRNLAEPDLIYVGCSINHLSKRWGNHMSCCFNKNNPAYNKILYKIMRDKGIENFKIELHEKFSCSSMEELKQREQQVIREIGTLNKIKNYGLSTEERKQYQQQYNENHKEEKKQYLQQYYQENKEERKQYQQQYNENHKEENKQYRENHKEENKQYHHQYRENHKENKILCNICNKSYNKYYIEKHKKIHREVV